MKKIWTSSALFIGTIAIISLTVLGLREHDVALHIATIALGIAGARSWEGIKSGTKE